MSTALAGLSFYSDHAGVRQLGSKPERTSHLSFSVGLALSIKSFRESKRRIFREGILNSGFLVGLPFPLGGSIFYNGDCLLFKSDDVISR